MADIIVGDGNLGNSVPDIASGVLTGLIAALAPLAGVKVRLFQNDIFPTPASVVGDFTEADYTGYVAGGITVTWHAVTTDDAGRPETIGNNCIFAATGTTIANTIYGYYVVDAGGAFVWGARLAAPEIFNSVGDSICVVPRYQATT